MYAAALQEEQNPDDGLECRICRSGVDLSDPEDEPLCTPCKCSGSIGNIHQSCLEQWLAHKHQVPGAAVCELCNYQFKFEPVYKDNTPEVLSTTELLIAGIVELAKWLPKALRVALVLLIWCVGLPFVLSHGYAYLSDLFSVGHTSMNSRASDRAPPYFIPASLPSSWTELLSDIEVGIFLAASVVICGLAFLAFIDFYRVHLEDERFRNEEENLRVAEAEED